MSEGFDTINAPQFFDFTASEDEDDADMFFELTNTPAPRNNLQESRRMSMSTGDVSYLQEALQRATISSNNDDGNKSPTQSLYGSCKSSGIRKTDQINPLKKTISQDSINRLAQPKRNAISNETVNRKEYVPLAEAVKKFQRATPKRFHNTAKQEVFHHQQQGAKAQPTQPLSPNLRTNSRNKPIVDTLTREEREWLEFQEHQRFKIRANPLNKKVLQGPVKPLVAVEKKSATVVEPFKLTEVHKKVIEPPKLNTNEFHAKPVPKSLHQPFKLSSNSAQPLTECKTPSFMKKYKFNSVRRASEPKEQIKPPSPKKSTPSSSNKSTNSSGTKSTRPLPFSFEVRDRMLQAKKEKFIKEFIEKEKKAREFHANPLPKCIMENNRNTSCNSSQKSLKRTDSQDTINNVYFKAKPAKVLQAPPFIPAKSDMPLTEITDFKLNTEMRKQKRDQFEEKMKEREAKLEMYRQQAEMEKKMHEEEVARQLRKEMEFKAQPIKKYKEVEIEFSYQVTVPVSPKFARNLRK